MVCVNAGADIAVGITINGEIIETDVSPFVENGRTLVPLRAVSEHLKYSVEWFAEEMGCEVNWDEENNIANVIKYNIAEANTPHYIILNAASYTKIILKEQEYDLSELDAINIDNPNVFADDTFEGYEYIIKDVSNLVIEAPEHKCRVNQNMTGSITNREVMKQTERLNLQAIPALPAVRK